MKCPKAVIVGGGSIGALKPDNIDNKDKKYSLTHARSLWELNSNNEVDFIGVVEPDKKKQKKITEKWGVPCFDDIDAIKYGIDIYVLCVPTINHYELLEKIIKHKPKIIVAEKPFCRNSHEAKNISLYACSQGIKIIVNYTRRFVTQYQYVRNLLYTIGDIYSTNVIYTRGLQRECCHAIDLMNWWFGEIEEGCILDSVGYDDFSKDDLTYPVYMKYKKCDNIFLCPVDGRAYCIFEIDVLYKFGRIKFFSNGTKIATYTIDNNNMYGDYNSIVEVPTIRDTKQETALSNLWKHVLEIYNNTSAHIMCGTNNAIKVHGIYEKLNAYKGDNYDACD